MKDFTINGWSLRFDNGTSRIIRDARGIKEENALDGIEVWNDMAPWILFGGIRRSEERQIPGTPDDKSINIELARRLIDELSPSETVDLINAYVMAMTVTVDEGQAVAKEGEPEKKS